MKVLFLGAGASIPAGYPPALKLLSKVREAFVGSRSVSERQALASWDRAMADAEKLGLSRLLMESPNPEIPLSLLDLWEQAQDEAGANFMRSARDGAPDEKTFKAHFSDKVRVITDARRAMHRLLAHYFATATYQDFKSRPASRRYLRRILDRLAPADVVITLNWDTTVEMTLAERGRWFARDGYGLSTRLRVDHGLPKGTRAASLRSEVTVLKLHGGVGWKIPSFEADRIYLSHAYLLQHLPTTVGRTRVFFKDDKPIGEPIEALDDLLVIPSYLKRIWQVPDMELVWRKAAQALSKASEVQIWGYGLPDSDGEVRLLLSALRPRLDRDRVKVAVHNPAADARDRWRRLLGPRAKIDATRL
jgi:hypothetical protein